MQPTNHLTNSISGSRTGSGRSKQQILRFSLSIPILIQIYDASLAQDCLWLCTHLHPGCAGHTCACHCCMVGKRPPRERGDDDPVHHLLFKHPNISSFLMGFGHPDPYLIVSLSTSAQRAPPPIYASLFSWSILTELQYLDKSITKLNLLQRNRDHLREWLEAIWGKWV